MINTTLSDVQKQVNDIRNTMIDIEKLSINPTMMVIPGSTIEYLAKQGYDTKEKIQTLVKNIKGEKLD